MQKYQSGDAGGGYQYSRQQVDVAALIYEKGQIQIEEVKPTEDHVSIRGRLLFPFCTRLVRRGRSWFASRGKFLLKSSFIWKEYRERMP